MKPNQVGNNYYQDPLDKESHNSPELEEDAPNEAGNLQPVIGTTANPSYQQER